MLSFVEIVTCVLLQEENVAGPGGVLGTGSVNGSDPRTLGSNISYNDKDTRLPYTMPRVYRRNLSIDGLAKLKKKKKYGR